MKNAVIIAVAIALATCFGHMVFRAKTTEDISSVDRSSHKLPIVVIGSSAAGTSVVKTLVASNSYAGPIVWVSQETDKPYNTVFLSDVLEESKTVNDIALQDPGYNSPQVKKMFGKELTKILPQEKAILLDDGQKIPYAKLFLGIGTKLTIPSKYQEIQGVFTFDRLSDVTNIQSYIKKQGVKRVAVVGAGLNGLEIADVLNDMRMTVYLIDRHALPLSRYANEAVAQKILHRIAAEGVHFLGPNSVQDMHANDQGILTGITLTNNQEITCDMVIFTAGAQVNESLIADAAITMQGSGIVVDSFMRTNYQDIYAAGDAVLIRDLGSGALRRSGKWLDALKQGAVAAANMIGGAEQFAGSIFPYIGRFFDSKVISCGPVSNPPVDYEQVVYDEDEGYRLFLLHGGKLKGFLLYGQSSFIDLLRLMRMIELATPVTVDQLPRG